MVKKGINVYKTVIFMFENFAIGLLILGVVFVGVFVGYFDLHKNSKTSSRLYRYSPEELARRYLLLFSLGLIIITTPLPSAIQLVICLSYFVGSAWASANLMIEGWQEFKNGAALSEVVPVRLFLIWISFLGFLLLLPIFLLYEWDYLIRGGIGLTFLLAGGMYVAWKAHQNQSLRPDQWAYFGAFIVLIILLVSVGFSMVFRLNLTPLHVAMERDLAKLEAFPSDQEEQPAQEVQPTSETPPSEKPAEPNTPTTLEEQAPVEEGSGGLEFTDPSKPEDSLPQVTASTSLTLSPGNRKQLTTESLRSFDGKQQFQLILSGEFNRGDIEIHLGYENSSSITLKPLEPGSFVFPLNGKIRHFWIYNLGDSEVMVELSI